MFASKQRRPPRLLVRRNYLLGYYYCIDFEAEQEIPPIFINELHFPTPILQRFLVEDLVHYQTAL